MSTRLVVALRRWVDSSAEGDQPRGDPRGIDWPRVIPFVALHLGCLGVIWTSWSPFAAGLAAALFVVRMFAITAFYHRYFSHRAFRTSRGWQFVFAVLGASAVQRGPLWWAAHHRNHHKTSDREDDVHSPHRHGFLWSHIGWITSRPNFLTRLKDVPDLVRFPELRFLDRFDSLVPILLLGFSFALGWTLDRVSPGLGTSGMQLFIWAIISTVVLFHGTSTINSLSHQFGTRPYETPDQSRNNALLALLTLGEGWHNNHHHYPSSVRQGFRWWQIDITYGLLVMLSWTGLIWELKPVPVHVRVQGRRHR